MYLLKGLLTIFCFQNSWGAEMPTVRVVKESFKMYSPEQYHQLLRAEVQHGNRLTKTRIIEWRYNNRTGKLLLAQVQGNNFKGCVMYKIDVVGVRSLGGNDNCTWSGNPYIVWKEGAAWIEFPARIHPGARIPVTTNQLTVHFSKATDDICVLGLPPIGFADLSCPEGEPPQSR